MMFGVFGYDLLKNWEVLDFTALWEIALGLGFAFVTALIVVRWVLNYVSSRGYALFGWWRIVVGVVAMLGLSFLLFFGLLASLVSVSFTHGLLCS